MFRVFIIFVVVLCAYILYETAVFGIAIYRAKEVIRQSERYEQHPENPTVSLVVFGDSTAYGTGASEPQTSLAGRIGTAHPTWNIENRGENGLRIHELADMLSASPKDERYDIALIQIGGNDVIRFTPLSKIENDITKTINEAKHRAKLVILMPAGNIGAAQAFSPFFRTLYEYRTRQVREVLKKAADDAEVHFIDLFNEREDDPFTRSPETYYAPDGLHPSSAGYGLWYEEVAPTLEGF